MEKKEIIFKEEKKIIYKIGDTVYKDFSTTYTMEEVLNEALNQARVDHLDFKVPKVKGVSIIEGRCVILSEYIEGQKLKSLMDSDKKNLNTYLAIFVDLQRKISSVSYNVVTNSFEKMMNSILSSDIRATIRYDLCLKLKNLSNSKNICHGDFYPDNIIVTNNNEYYILDWAHVTFGNPLSDVANTYLKFILDDKEDMANTYFNMYIEKQNIDKEQFNIWVPIVACAVLYRYKNNATLYNRLINIMENYLGIDVLMI